MRFRTFAPSTTRLELQLQTGAAAGVYRPTPAADGLFEIFISGASAGDRYAYTLDGSDPRPDPASRFQPDGVHGASQVVDPAAYRWRQAAQRAPDPRDLVVYELHVGTFTPDGTFAAIVDKLPALVDLGITAIELMPIADFAGSRNWGYDGAALYAPARVYGRPDDLRALVDGAHQHGIAVLLDVVYNHLGPEGAYLTLFHPNYITTRHTTPWGGAVNLDGPGSALVRRFIIDNALHWIREYRIDGLRLDATHALIDDSPTHMIAELVDTVREHSAGRVVVHGEDHRNLAAMIEPQDRGGWGLDGVWADDFHHVVRRLLAGDSEAYYQDYSGTAAELARTIRDGWLYTGQHSAHVAAPRGSDASSIPMDRFVVCLQNHDQVGNRALGERLHHQIDPAAWRAATVLLLTAPMTPLLFMGQEWSTSSRFLYFTDMPPELGRLVTEGRRREFAAFEAFADADARHRIPDPQASSTFAASRLDWAERDRAVHAATLALYRALLRLRHAHPALGADDRVAGDAVAVAEGGLVMRREREGARFVVLARLAGHGAVTETLAHDSPAPSILFSTEDSSVALDPLPPAVSCEPGRVTVDFARPGAVLLKLA